MRCEAVERDGAADSRQRIVPVRRAYNRWVADQTLEDYALRFTAKTARRWSVFRVANTALGGVSFLALEAIGAAVTLTYGFSNAAAAIMVVAALIFVTGLPISISAARHGVDIDLLTRGAGFGYLGSTITSLIYASFTFIFFALEAAIMAKALQLGVGLPEWIGFIVSSLVVIPIVTYGFTVLSRFHLWTQPLWIALHIAPFVSIALFDVGTVEAWTRHTGRLGRVDGAFDLLLFGAASGVVFSLIAQIGEQVDFLRFLPPPRKGREASWWIALIATGPGWIVLGALKMLAGSFLAFLAFRQGVAPADATDPTHMYQVAFGYLTADSRLALAMTVVFVVVSQLKINATNAYAGSIAWSNFFSRLTHSHPGRVVWVVFNVAIALVLMELGIYRSLEHTLGLYSLIAVAWVGAIFADLVVNKPLGLSPDRIEFRRAHLYDINPVGFGAMAIASASSIAAYAGLFGKSAAALSPFVSLCVAILCAPAIAFATGGRFYIAPRRDCPPQPAALTCRVCEHSFEAEDMTHCPAYAAPICSLCCTLDARCNDRCKIRSRVSEQLLDSLAVVAPPAAMARLNSSLGHYFALLTLVVIVAAAILVSVYLQSLGEPRPPDVLLAGAMAKIFLVCLLIAGVVSWLFVLAHESRRVAQEESDRQTVLLMQEIAAHGETDRALQAAKEVAEAANLAKSRYVVGISHEFRTPLNAILGYAQLIDQDSLPPASRMRAIRTIRRSGEHLSSLVEGLLDIARIEAERLRPERADFAFPEFIEPIVATFRLQAETQGVALLWDAPPRLPAYVRSDEKRLRQILLNLLSNAVKFTRAGEVRFSLRFRNDVAEFVVQDSGVGIAESDLERIFMPFERIETPSGPWAPGTGLGLTITKLLTELMGGEISVSSRLGEGSRFVVRLHLPVAAAPAVSADPAPPITGYIGEPVIALVVDDQPSHRQLLADVLRPLGFEVAAAQDGASCLAMAETLRPGLVLLDISMPGMTGWEVARRLREDVMLTGAIIMVSADAAERPSSDPDRDDHDDYVVKPIDVDELLAKIGLACGLTWRRDDPTLARGQGPARIAPVAHPAPASDRERRPPPPDLADVEALAALARIGYLRALGAKIDEIAARAPAARGYLARLSALLADVDIDALLSELEMTLDELAKARNDA
jgi:signal transduction histidine kinase/CheY-like chemotaxis protein/purine-cytosine permease-like protein